MKEPPPPPPLVRVLDHPRGLGRREELINVYLKLPDRVLSGYFFLGGGGGGGGAGVQ